MCHVSYEALSPHIKGLKVKVAQSCPTLCVPFWNSLNQNTGVGSRSLLQGIFPTQGSNPGLPHCRRILYQLSHQGSPRILEWVAYPFSRDLPVPGIGSGSPALQADSLPAEPSRKPRKRLGHHLTNQSASPSPTFRAQMLNHL